MCRQFMRFLIFLLIFALLTLAGCAPPSSAIPVGGDAAAAAATNDEAAPRAEPADAVAEPAVAQAIAEIESAFAEKIFLPNEGAWAGDLIIVDEVLVYGNQEQLDPIVARFPLGEIQLRADLGFVAPAWQSRLYSITDGTPAHLLAEQINQAAQQAGIDVHAEPNLVIAHSGHGGSVFGSPSLPPWIGPQNGFDPQWIWGELGINLASERLWLGKGVTVALFDTCPATQPAWVDQMTLITTSAGVNQLYSEHGSGAAALIDYMAPEAVITLSCVLTTDGYGKLSDLVAGLAQVIQPYDPNTGRLVLNLSLGVHGLSPQLEAILQAAYEQGIVTVAAAGNQGDPTVMNTPAVYPMVIGVAGSTNARQPSNFTNLGDVAAPAGGDLDVADWDKVDCAAQPELFVITRADSSPTGYLCWVGTSFATPLVSGEAALLLEKAPTLTVDEVATKIYGTSDPVAPVLGAGIINVTLALQ